MKYADYKKFDSLNGKGMRHSLFCSGCTHRCKGCFNAVAWNFNYGKEFTRKLENQIISDLNDSTRNIQGLSLLGGEPFDNVEGLLPFLSRVRKECLNSDIWCWSGYTFDELLINNKEMLSLIDVLVDGKFILEERNLKLRFRGSNNQRIIDVQQSLAQNTVVLWQDGNY